jgi:uncharacterized protein (DUF1501 family)
MDQTRTWIDGNRDNAKTLVVIFLRGGADGLTLVPPIGDDSYHRARPQLGVAASEALRLDDLFGLNPALAPLHRIYQEAGLAVVHAAGSEDDTHSHFEAQDFMEHGGHAAGGWIGRWLRACGKDAAYPLAAVAFGKTAPESLRGAPSSFVLDSFDAFAFREADRYLDALGVLYAAETDDLGEAGHQALTTVRQLATLHDRTYLPTPGAIYPDSDFGGNLRRLAQLIKARIGLRAATVDLGGWDSHFAQSPLITPLMRELGQGIGALYADLSELIHQTTLVVMTEFGRRVYENASLGTDHGSGSIMLLAGSGVVGGKVIADWRELNDSALFGPGDVPVTTNYRDVLAPILQQHHADAELGTVFPGYELKPVGVTSQEG